MCTATIIVVAVLAYKLTCTPFYLPRLFKPGLRRWIRKIYVLSGWKFQFHVALYNKRNNIDFELPSQCIYIIIIIIVTTISPVLQWYLKIQRGLTTAGSEGGYCAIIDFSPLPGAAARRKYRIRLMLNKYFSYPITYEIIFLFILFFPLTSEEVFRYLRPRCAH